MHTLSLTALLVILAHLAGCATALSREAMALASPAVQPDAVLANPQGFIGHTLLVTGPILRLENRQDDTFLEVLGYPTTARGFPDTSEPALGRFLLRYPGYLDGMIYRPGRSIAAAGRVVGEQNAAGGEITPREPLLQTLELALLPEHPTYFSPIFIGIGIMGGF